MDTRQTKEIDCVAIDVAAMVYDDSLNSLRATLHQFDINPRAYTLLGVRDESTCLIYQDGEWATFFFERGQKTGESHFTDIDDACLEVLRSVGVGGSRQYMREYYQKELHKRTKKNPSSRELQECIRKGLERLSKSVAM